MLNFDLFVRKKKEENYQEKSERNLIVPLHCYNYSVVPNCSRSFLKMKTIFININITLLNELVILGRSASVCVSTLRYYKGHCKNNEASCRVGSYATLSHEYIVSRPGGDFWFVNSSPVHWQDLYIYVYILNWFYGHSGIWLLSHVKGICLKFAGCVGRSLIRPPQYTVFFLSFS